MSAVPSTAVRRPAARPRPERGPTLRVVKAARHTARYVVAVLLLGALGVFGIVTLSALAAEASFAARALERDIDTLTLRYDELTAEVASLESPERVRDVAVHELGMVPAEQAAYLVVDEPLDAGRTVPAAPASETDDVLLADPLKQALGTGG